MTALNSLRTTPVRGHYSLIQFCPDTTRLETANIGIALFCGEQSFLQTRMSANNRRVAKLFSRGDHDLRRLQAVKNSLQQTLESRRDEMNNLEQLQRFASMHVNHLRMTPFMPCRIAGSPAAELETLYSELVEDHPGDQGKPKTTVEKLLDAVFSQPAVSPFIQRNVEVEVPVFQSRDSIPYAYQNGKLNLIKPIEFPKKPGAVIDKAARNAVEGKSIFENPHDEYGELQLVVVGAFPKTKSADIETAKRIFEDNRVRLYTTEQLDELQHEIVTHGHRVAP